MVRRAAVITPSPVRIYNTEQMKYPLLTQKIEKTRHGYCILTWGCQMNEEDSEQLALQMEALGYTPVKSPEHADVVILNTCSVRSKPEEKVYSKLGELRELKRNRPDLIVAVCGCMAQIESESIRQRAPFVDVISGTGNVGTVGNYIQAAQNRRHDPTSPAPITALDLPSRKGTIVTDVPSRNINRRHKLKAFVPISYGCDKFCTFCVVPLTRGRERSRPVADIIQEITRLAETGTKEVTLLGQTVNSYGKNLAEGRTTFANLLRLIDRIPGIERIRFTSPYPRDFSDDLIEAIAYLPSVCEHVHLPLQVADDELLLDMHRGYTVSEYQRVLDRLRDRVPGIAVTTDLMLGYPGETETQFRNTLDFVSEARFDSAFMFAYSPRPGTRAASRADQVSQETKLRRLAELIAMQNEITTEINRAPVGETVEVLVEGRSPKDPSKLSGLTRNFKTVNFEAPPQLIGKTVRVQVTMGHLWGFSGRLTRLSAQERIQTLLEIARREAGTLATSVE